MTALQRRYAGDMPQGPRIERVGEEFREILAEEIPKLKDPRIGFVTVTGVKVTADLRRAWVYYTAFGDDGARVHARGAPFGDPRLRGVIGKQVRMKFLPELQFEEDATLEQAARDRPADRDAERRRSVDGNDGGCRWMSSRAPPRCSARATEVALACHLNPDADALGSMLGLSAFLRARGTTTVCSFPNEPLKLPRWASFLPGSDDLVEVADYPRAPARDGHVRLRVVRPARARSEPRRRAPGR